MYKPDHVIVRKIKAYDPYLFVKYNNQKGYLEIWREMVWGSRLITPVVPSLFYKNAKRRFMQLDDRIIWWLYEADMWKGEHWTKENLKRDRRWKEFQKNQRVQRLRSFKDMAKDMYSIGEAFFTKKTAKKNDVNKAFQKAIRNKWVKPDMKSSNSHRLLVRSKANALNYDYKPK